MPSPQSPKLVAVEALNTSFLTLSRLADPSLQSDGLRFETSLGRVVVLSGRDVEALCKELPDLFPEHFSGGNLDW